MSCYILARAVALVLLVTILWPRETESQERERNRLFVGLGGQERNLDVMVYSDVLPVTHGETGGRVEAGYLMTGSWWFVAAGHLGGAWFDFSGPAGSSKIEELSWLLRAGVDRQGTLVAGALLEIGVGAEYGETRSWLDALSTSDEGPHVFIGGGYLKLGVSSPRLGPVRGYVEVVQSVYHAHARRATFQDKFNWLGRSLEGAAGVRFFFTPPLLKPIR